MSEAHFEAMLDDIPESGALPGPGHRLRLARERMEMQTAEIAERLHLAERLVVALENDDYAQLPDPVFTKGYLRNYARLVGEPVDEILEIFAKTHPTQEYQPVVRRSHTRIPARQVTSSHGVVKTITWLLIVALLILLIVAWRGYIQLPVSLTGDDLGGSLIEPAATDADNATMQVLPVGGLDSMDEDRMAAPAESASNPVEQDAAPTDKDATMVTDGMVSTTSLLAIDAEAVALPVVDGGADDAKPGDEQPMASGAAAAEEASQDDAASTEGTTTDVAADEGAVVLEFSAPCWVDVRDASGTKVLYGARDAGERHSLSGTPPYRFVLGNGGAVRITVGGKPYDTSRFSSGQVARFSLDPADMRVVSSESRE